MIEKKAFSAPGKALLAGGYLVLDPKYGAYVVALSSRMHSIVKHEITSDSAGSIIVNVKSAQFNGDEWSYIVDSQEDYSPRELNNQKNPFIEKSLLNVFNYFQPDLKTHGDILIEVYSDPGYHSRENTVTRTNSVKSFCFHHKSISEVPKTGLGSSAGLVTVLVTSLVSCFKEDLSVNSEKDLNLIHNLSQIAHCQAQGKIGSGFDVAAATFGSIYYHRFDPAIINNLPESSSNSYHSALVKLVDNTDWKITNTRITLPPKLRLIMGDVNNGSETTKLVMKVNEWYSNYYPNSLAIYTKIDEGNIKLVEALRELNSLHKSDEVKYSAMISSIDRKESEFEFSELAKIKSAVNQIRTNFQIITSESGADIEPEVQTKLLDDSIKLPGVLTGVVPGAGGYDAICLIATESCDIVKATANKPSFKSVSWLDLHQEDLGIVEENPKHYSNLK